MMRHKFLLGLMMALVSSVAVAAENEEVPDTMHGLPLVFTEDFEDGADSWEPTDSEAWRVVEEDGNHVYNQFQGSDYEPPHRSPYNISLIKDLWVSDFVFQVKAKQTGEEYGHRDLCFFYNYVDPAHFYYTHIASAADAHANSIFLVNEAARTSIAKMRNDGTQWEDGNYHTIRIVRKTGPGLIEVYFDNMSSPIMRTEDRHFRVGRLGIGSFDDQGRFDDVRVWAKKEENPNQ